MPRRLRRRSPAPRQSSTVPPRLPLHGRACPPPRPKTWGDDCKSAAAILRSSLDGGPGCLVVSAEGRRSWIGKSYLVGGLREISRVTQSVAGWHRIGG